MRIEAPGNLDIVDSVFERILAGQLPTPPHTMTTGKSLQGKFD